MKELSISEVTKITGLSRTTLLYYESKGLLHPSQAGEGSYRKYTMDDISQIMFYQSMKPLDVSVEEYTAAVGGAGEHAPDGDIYELIQQKKSAYLRRMALYISMWEETTAFGYELRKKGGYCGFQMSKDAWAVSMEEVSPMLLKQWGQYFLQRNLSYFFHGCTQSFTRGLTCYADCAMPLSHELRSQLQWLPGKPCLLIAEPIDLRKEVFLPIFHKAAQVLKTHELTVNGDPWGNIGYRETRAGKPCDYFFLWIPVKPIDSTKDLDILFQSSIEPAQEPETAKRQYR